MAIDLEEYIRNLERAGGQTIGPGPGAAQAARQQEQRGGRFVSDVAASISPPIFPDIRPVEDQTGLPAALALVGGVAPFVAPEARLIRPIAQLGKPGTTARALLPSLAGSSAGSALGTFGEAGLTGKNVFTTDFGKQLIGNLVENAAWDLGGNLSVIVGGKALKVGKEQLSKFGGGDPATTDPRLAAQRFFSEKGATLTRGQLTGDTTTQIIENIIKGGPSGTAAFAKQTEGVKTALTQGVQDVKNTLQTSDSFKQALATEQPLTLAAGENFQGLITTARDAFKDKYRPFYQSLTQNNGVYVDLRGVKKLAQQEYDQLAKSKFKGAAGERKAVLDDVLAQDDFVEFGVAHDLRSNFSGSANDLVQPGKGTTTKGAAYSKYSSNFEKAMDDAVQLAADTPQRRAALEKRKMQYVPVAPGQRTTVSTGPEQFNPFVVETPLSKDTITEYNRVKGLYKEGQNSLFNETIVTAMQQSPSKVGSYLADLTEAEKFTDLYKALSAVDTYVGQAGKESAGALGNLKYSFLETNLSTPEKILKFNQNLNENPDLKKAFYKLYRNEAPKIQEILNAADIGLTRETAGASYLRTRGASVAFTGAAGTLGYLALPEDVQNRIGENLPQSLATAGAIILTPRLLAKASTNKEAMDALAGLAKASKQPKIAGATAAKIVDQLNKSGIIDSEYITEIDNLFNKPQQQEQTPTTSSIDLERYIQELGQ